MFISERFKLFYKLKLEKKLTQADQNFIKKLRLRNKIVNRIQIILKKK